MSDYPIMQDTIVDIRLTRSSEGAFLLTVHDRLSRGRIVNVEMDAEAFADLMSNRGVFDIPAKVATAEVMEVIGRKRLSTAVRLANDFHPDLTGEPAIRALDLWMLHLNVNAPEAFGSGATIGVSSVRGGYDVIVRHYSAEDIAGVSQQEWLRRAVPSDWKLRA